MKQVTLTICLICSAFCNAQVFKDDWKDFSLAGWNVRFEKDTFMHRTVKCYGSLVFCNQKDSNIDVSFYVLKRKELDKAISDSATSRFVLSSCTYGSANDIYFNSFDLNDYYYEYTPCNHCDTDSIKDCEVLATHLSNEFIWKGFFEKKE